MRSLRQSIVLLAALAVFPAVAQQPAGLTPLLEPPPPPAGLQLDPSLEPEVTITKRGEDKVEEYRVHGKLYMQKVTPSHGVPYYLIDSRGDGTWSRQESLDSGLRVPMWVIHSF
jgi:hypothetical protein